MEQATAETEQTLGALLRERETLRQALDETEALIQAHLDRLAAA